MNQLLLERLILLIVGIIIGLIIALILYKTIDKPHLIKQQCAEYNSTTGDFVIRNLLKD